MKNPLGQQGGRVLEFCYMRSVVTAIILSVVLSISACETVPITQRQQLILVPASSIDSMSSDFYRQFLSENKTAAGSQQEAAVKRVGHRIQSAVEQYFAQAGMTDRLRGYQWEFVVVQNPEMNAFCLSNGKVVVYTGILPITQDDTGLATVMGHEIAHAVARHAAERMSQSLLTEMGGMALSEALVSEPGATRDLFRKVIGVGSQVGVALPHSRTQESEADRLGLVFMAMAGYDPNGAVAFWQRMANAQKGRSTPEFLATHPSDVTRINEIRQHIPEAMGYFRSN
jgi:predicted Zn-dependent protease